MNQNKIVQKLASLVEDKLDLIKDMLVNHPDNEDMKNELVELVDVGKAISNLQYKEAPRIYA